MQCLTEIIQNLSILNDVLFLYNVIELKFIVIVIIMNDEITGIECWFERKDCFLHGE